MVQLSSHMVHSCASHFATCVNGALMGVQPGKCGQQRRMNIEQSSFVALYKTWREDSHEARQHNQGRATIRIMGVDRIGQRRIKGLARFKRLVVQHLRRQPVLTGKQQAPGIGPIADDPGNPRTSVFAPHRIPMLPLCGLYDGLHVGARARDQNNDVFHDWIIPVHNDTALTLPPSACKGAMVLTPFEARVLGTLMEKARTVPDSYPLTLNSLMLGCNQKSSREPAMNMTEAQVAEALDNLKSLNLVRESSGSRVTRFEHNFQRGVGVPEQSAVLLGLLMLRGPQTAGELRLNTERWYKFADISSVDGFLEELQERSLEKGGPLVMKLPKAPGAREQRWAHLLSGPVDASVLAGGDTASTSTSTAIEMENRVVMLENEVAQLRQTVQRLCTELGMAPITS